MFFNGFIVIFFNMVSVSWYANTIKKNTIEWNYCMKKVRIGVLMGGKSLEKEVSFNSGRTVCDHLDTARYDIVPLFQSGNTLFILPWHFLHRGKTTDFEHRLEKEAAQLCWDDVKKYVDFMYIAQHGRYAEDGILQGFLEILGIPYFGSDVLASALRMDKIAHKSFLQKAGIDIPRFVVVEPYEIEQYATCKDVIAQRLESAGIYNDFVVKPYNEGSSIGVSIVDKDGLENALRIASFIEVGKKKRVIIEEKIQGMEFTCITLVDAHTGEYISLPPTEIICEAGAQFFDYEQKYMPGRGTKRTPAQCTERIMDRIKKTCVTVMKVLGFTTMSRIDGFVTADERIVIIDPNTLSGMAPSSFIFNQAAEVNMSPSQIINYLIEAELQNYGMLAPLLEEEKREENIMHQTTKKRIAVLFGGRSNEKEISLESGRNIFYKLSPHKYEALPIFVTNNLQLYHITQSQIVRNSTREISEVLDESQRIKWSDLPKIADFVFIGLHGGEGENGCVQGALEMLGMPYNGSSVLPSALCMNKYKANEFLAAHGFDVPKNMLLARQEWYENQDEVWRTIADTFAFPFIVKPYDDGCSVMVQRVESKQDFVAAVDMIFVEKAELLIEEFVAGMELTVGVLGNEHPRALPPSQAVAAHGILSIQEKFLPGAGENQTPAPLPAHALQFVQEVIARAFKTMQCKGYARIDCFYQSAQQSATGKERVVILEFNTLPGMTPATCLFHQAAEIGMRPMDFIDAIIQLGFEEHGGSLETVQTIHRATHVEYKALE